MGFRFLGRKEAGKNRCPICRMTGVNFIIVGEGLLGCFNCRNVFVRKETPVDREVLVPKDVTGTPVSSLETGMPGIESVIIPQRVKKKKPQRLYPTTKGS